MLSFPSRYTPRRPSSFSPQHLTVLSSIMAHVISFPATMEIVNAVGRSGFARFSPISPASSPIVAVDPTPN